MVLLEHVLGDQDLVDFVGPIRDPQRAGTLVHGCEREIARHARGAPHLNRPVDDAVIGGRHEDLDRGDIRARIDPALHLLGGVDRHQPRRLNVDVGVRDEALDELLRLQQAAMHLARHGALQHQVEGAPHLPD